MTLLDKVRLLLSYMQRAITDFASIKLAIINKGVEIPEGTTTSEFADKIAEIQSGGGEYDQAFIDAIFANAVEELLITSTAIVDQGCRGRTKLKKVTLTKVQTINSYGFYNCSALETMIITAASVPTLKNVNAFTNTPIANGTGYFYVHKNFIEVYKTATNWSTFANQFRAIEDYPNVVNDEGGETNAAE